MGRMKPGHLMGVQAYEFADEGEMHILGLKGWSWKRGPGREDIRPVWQTV